MPRVDEIIDQAEELAARFEDHERPILVSSSRKALFPCWRSPASLMISAMATLPTSGYRPSSVDRRDHSESLSGQDWILIWLEILLAIGAVIGAVGIIWGDILGDAVYRLPFGSAILAGLALFTINGLYPLTVVIGSLRHQQWVRWGHIVVGFALMGWIAVQIAGTTGALAPGSLLRMGPGDRGHRRVARAAREPRHAGGVKQSPSRT